MVRGNRTQNGKQGLAILRSLIKSTNDLITNGKWNTCKPPHAVATKLLKLSQVFECNNIQGLKWPSDCYVRTLLWEQ